MKKRIGKFFIILGVIFFCLTPFYSVHGEDYYHYNVFDILDNNGNQIGSAEYVLYQDFMVAHERTYVSELTINFAAYYRGPVTVSRRTYQSDYILVEGASISSATDSGIIFWLAGSNYVHIKWYSSADFNTGGYFPADVFTTGLTMVEMSPGESRQEIIDALDTSNGNWTSLLQQMNDIKNLFGTGSDIQNVDVDSIRGMLNTIRSEILAIGVLDGVIATKVGELSGIADNIELLLEQIGYIAANVQVIADQMDLTDLQNAVDDLTVAINNLSGSINITNNIDLSIVDPVSLTSYLYFSRYSGITYGLTNFNYPRYSISAQSNVSNAYTASRRITIPAKTTYLLAFFANGDITATNFPHFTANSNVNITFTYQDYLYPTFRLEQILITNNENSRQSVSFDLLNNSSITIIPLYLGDINNMSDLAQQISNYRSIVSSQDYTSYLESIVDLLEDVPYDDSAVLDKLDDVIAAINQLSINVDYDEVNTTVNNFNIDIDSVHNTETNILNSFNTYRQRFNTTILEDNTWFSPVLFNYIFNNVWSNHIPWVITLILFCSLVVALVGLKK